jgi:ribosomal protein L7Ae-like RNA K-turn-binding protein
VTVDGGPDEVVQVLTHTAALRGIPVVFALSRKLLGKVQRQRPLSDIVMWALWIS